MSAKAKSELTYYLCGGTGINIGKALKKIGRTEVNKQATLVALDASEANKAEDLFPVEHITLPDDPTQKTKGSGKIQSTNYAAAQPFVDAALTKHKPGTFNVVVCNTAGGTGSMLAVLVFRWLKKHGHPVVGLFIGDKTSQVEFANSVATLTVFSNQVKKEVLDSPIPYLEFWNTDELTRGEINGKIVDRLDILSLFLTESNEEQDFEDMKNLLEYSKYHGIPPALSRISFVDEKHVDQFKGPMPVAVASLFTEADKIVPRFKGTVVRSTGVFKAGVQRPGNVEELHMILDHGQAVKDLEQEIAALDEMKAETKKQYVPQKDLSQGAQIDANGFAFGS